MARSGAGAGPAAGSAGTRWVMRRADIEARFCRLVSGTATRAELRRWGGWTGAGSTGSGSGAAAASPRGTSSAALSS